ncbi:MAG: hypothetical protein PF569_04525 [Candidatus Woesearchaeota archaeon]|jgi:hypothetical protein|nr:hypothetical protein [Candidatus Woesearchaeota archaeon]
MSLEIYNLATEDLQLRNRWYCYFQDMPKTRFMVKTINLPFDKLVTETKKYGSKKYVGFTPPETITITFFENTKFEIYKYFKSWMDTIFDPVTKTFNVLEEESVKFRTATIEFYTHIPLEFTTLEFKLNDLMILGLDELSLDQETGEPLEWSVQLAVRDSSLSSVSSFVGNIGDNIQQQVNSLVANISI